MGNIRKTLDRFFNNKYSRRDYFTVHREFEKEENNQVFLDELEDQWDELKDKDTTGFHDKRIWGKVLTHIELNNTKRVTKIDFLSQLQRIAAILFVPLFIASIVYFFVLSRDSYETAWAEIVCPSGARTEFQLPDGSTGVLNSESTLKYATDFRNNRKVQLEGEGYFDVVKNKKRPFSVITERLKIEVLGTSFSVTAYQGQMTEEVILKTGSVKVLSRNDKPIALLSPDQQFSLDKSKNQFAKKDVNAQALTSWINGKLVIENERFEDIAKRLSRWYDVEIVIQDQRLKDYKYYGTFENEPLSEVLRLVVLTAPIKYQDIEKEQKPDGSFTKRKIILKTDERRITDFK